MFAEDKTTEFKREYTDGIKNTVVAFANTDGGKIYIGIDDTGRPVGVSDPDDTMLRVTSAIRDNIRPDVTLFTDCSVCRMDDKSVVVVNVQRGTARPYYLAGKGIRPEGVYVRHGASTIPAAESAIFSMIKETSGDSYEEARSLCQQLTFDRTSAFFARRGVEFNDAQKRTLGLTAPDGTFTNLAALLSEQCSHTIKAALFDGDKKSVFRDRQEFSGSLLAQLDDSYAYIDGFNKTRSEFSGLDRIDMRDYPPEAVREALLNAVVHRDYSYSDATLISIFDDRMEFVTLGGLVSGISYDDLRLGVSVPRNQRLANVFYRLRLIEAYGTGLMKVDECYGEYSVKPKIEVSSNAFKITLPNTNFVRERAFSSRVQSPAYNLPEPEDEREAAVLKLFASRGTIVRRDVQDALGVSQATAILLLRKMTENGVLVRSGGGRRISYRLAR